MSRRTLAGVVFLIVLAVAGVGIGAQDAKPAHDSGASARLATAREALKTIEQMREAGQHLDLTKHYLWSRRLMEAERDIAATKPERVAATKAHVDRMSRLMKDMRAQYEHAEVSRLDFLDIQFHNDEALSWWEREQVK